MLISYDIGNEMDDGARSVQI